MVSLSIHFSLASFFLFFLSTTRVSRSPLHHSHTGPAPQIWDSQIKSSGQSITWETQTQPSTQPSPSSHQTLTTIYKNTRTPFLKFQSLPHQTSLSYEFGRPGLICWHLNTSPPNFHLWLVVFQRYRKLYHERCTWRAHDSHEFTHIYFTILQIQRLTPSQAEWTIIHSPLHAQIHTLRDHLHHSE